MTFGDIAAEIERKAAGRRLLLLLEVEGTLCGFGSELDEVDVDLEPAVRRALDDLAHADGLTLGYISGRSVADVRRRVPVGPTTYIAAVHGLEIEGPSGRCAPDAGLVPAVRAIRDIADRLRRELAAWPGVRIDDKGSAVALHTRDAASGVRVLAEDRLLRLTAAHPAATELALLEGDGVLELLPAARRAKRDALRWIRDREEDVRGSCFTIFIGDGTTGEDVFRAVGPHGLTIAASDRAAGADFHLPGPAGVAYLLVLMASASPGEFPAIP